MDAWRATDWWEMPGPSRFLERAVLMVAGSKEGVAGLLLPSPEPDGLLGALIRRIEASISVTVIPVDAAAGLKNKSPVSLLAASAGVRTTGMRSVGEFLGAPDLSGTVFLVNGILADEWHQWAYFLKYMRSERARRERSLAPSVIVVVPSVVPPSEARAALGSELRWSGYVSRNDTHTWVERLLGWPDDSLLSRVAVAVAVELSGWDPAIAKAFAQQNLELLVDPRDHLKSIPDFLQGRHPCWANGMVDRWDGFIWVHTAALASAGLHKELALRVWRGQVRAVFPFLEQVRTAFVAKYEDRLKAQLPRDKIFHSRTVRYDDPSKLEFFELNEMLASDLPPSEARLMMDCRALRRSMAHFEPGSGLRLKRLSDAWEDLSHEFPDECNGWEWPRCGQKLVILVGPSGAGKSTWASRHYDPEDIVSSDAIRVAMFGTQDMGGDQEPVFQKLRAEVRARLASGRTAVIDATNLDKRHRAANAMLAPADIPVEYVVIDRPMAEKTATAGWRAEKPGLLEIQAAQFSRELPEILEGDHLGRIIVNDLRVEDTSYNRLVEAMKAGVTPARTP
jgi:predicted kinase